MEFLIDNLSYFVFAMEKFICIHGHFYQPPRENAWLEVIEQQDSAYPYHDWNERITHECYGPNGASRILDKDQHIINILNNYSRISFNFGPTLLQWMEQHAPETYQSILDADKQSQKLFGGHGNAIAQVYNHIIMPLASKQDKETQVIWGIRDFEHRFGRKPEGMWLAETAVDTETLEVLAENDIVFTILAPRQASMVRRIGATEWEDVSGEKVDTRRPYICKLPSGKSIVLFYYDGKISQDIAFKGLLIDGLDFANQLFEGFSDEADSAQLVHVATDGESYGHHHRHGDMALAFCLDFIERNEKAKLTNYGEFLDKVPPGWETQIFDNSSWSCVHGVERWRADCGCSSGMNAGWNQKWRKPLRDSLDWLRDELAQLFENELKKYCTDPWKVRNEYIDLILKRNDQTVEAFLLKHCKIVPQGYALTQVIRLLELQRHALLMFTSCGWFFDEISGIETTQILQYADRAIQLAESETKLVFEHEFLKRLSAAPSNLDDLKNGAMVHQRYVHPSRLTLSRVGSHYAVASLFEEYPESLTICNYRAESEKYQRLDAGSLRLAVGKTQVHSLITYSVREFYFAVIWLGQNHIIGNSSIHMEDDDFKKMQEEISDAFSNSRVAEVIGIMQTYFGPEKFSLWNLFKDDQRKVLNQIVMKDVLQAEDSFKRIYNRNYNLMTVMNEARLPIPAILVKNLENVINTELRHTFENGNLNAGRLENLALDAQKWNVELDKTTISFAASSKLYRLMQELTEHKDVKILDTFLRVFKVMEELDIELDLWELQNKYFSFGKELMQDNSSVKFKDPAAQTEFKKKFAELGKCVEVSLPQQELV